nr:hypothetical protein B0A51_07493 [Rachicladosporium sp. CCFEE 5018]
MALERRRYVGTFIHSTSLTDLEICEEATIGVDENGKIAYITRIGDEKSTSEDWELFQTTKLDGNKFFFPGFIDTHIHASQYPNAGVFGKSTLLDWLNTYTFPLESSFSDTAIASKVYSRVVARTLSQGTTTACYYATTHVPATNILADICLKRGQRAFVGRVCMDRMSPEYYRDESTESAIADTRSCISHIRSIDPSFDLISPIITPRFAPSCHTATLAALGALQKETNLPVQTHISENTSEIALVAELFPEADSYAHIYDTAGLLTPKTVLAHAVHLSPAERQLIKSRDAKISHCPASNTAITSGRTKVRELLDEGLTLGLGTDVSGGHTSSMLSEAREALFVSRHVAMTDGDNAKLAVEEALYLATRGGAKVVGLESRIGGFEVGMDWDAQVVGLGDTVGTDEIDQREGLLEIFGKETWEEKVAKWVYTGDDRNTLAVWVKGRLVHKRSGFNI